MRVHDLFQQRKLIEEIIGRKFSKESIIVDLGGGAGGFLNAALSKECDCYIVDYDETISDYAESIGIKKINGGLEDFEKLNICPDLIISITILNIGQILIKKLRY